MPPTDRENVQISGPMGQQDLGFYLFHRRCSKRRTERRSTTLYKLRKREKETEREKWWVPSGGRE